MSFEDKICLIFKLKGGRENMRQMEKLMTKLVCTAVQELKYHFNCRSELKDRHRVIAAPYTCKKTLVMAK